MKAQMGKSKSKEREVRDRTMDIQSRGEYPKSRTEKKLIHVSLFTEKQMTQNNTDNSYKQCRATVKEYLSRGECTSALDEINQYLQKHPTDAEGYSLRANVYIHLRQLEKVKEDSLRAISHDSNSPSGYHYLGVYYRLKNMYPEAIRAFENALERDPENYSVLINLGIVYICKGMLKVAVGYFTRAQKIDPDNHAAYEIRHRCYLDLGYNRLAREDLWRLRSLKAKRD
jgi:tetratricopeptide (TPR) repeat protein